LESSEIHEASVVENGQRTAFLFTSELLEYGVPHERLAEDGAGDLVAGTGDELGTANVTNCGDG